MTDAVRSAGAGDRVALADTGLVVQVESDADLPGGEFLVGWGQPARDGMHLQAASVEATCDLLVSNVVILDPVAGVRKASVGIRRGRISGIGRAGNPHTMDDVDVVVGTGTTIIDGDGLLLTAGAIDTHVHLMSPRVLEACLSSGVTTVIGQEFGPVWGVGVNSPWALAHTFAAFDAWPVNVGFLARGSSSSPEPLVEALVEGGACGFKVHEDMGAHARALDTALTVAEEYDVQVALHTDGFNESLSVADTVAVLEGRTIHAFHVEGCGGGHAPDVLSLAGVPNVIGSSTNPTLPYGRDAVSEHLAMILAVHGTGLDEEAARRRARARIRGQTMAAENVLHDLGVIPITSSDAQGMGRAGETIQRTFAMAAKMKAEFGSPNETHDNDRVLRYLAKLTINPAIAHGLVEDIGSVEVGKRADLVLWDPRFFGVKPDLVLKSGYPAWGVTGDPNSTIDRAEPLVLGPQFGGHGATPADLSVAYVSSAFNADPRRTLPTRRRPVPVHHTRGIGLADMVRNHRTGQVVVDPRTADVSLDGSPISCQPAESVTLNRRYLL